MDHVELGESFFAEGEHARIPRCRSIVRFPVQIDRLDRVRRGTPAPTVRLPRIRSLGECLQSEVRGQDRDLVAALLKTSRQGANLDSRSASFEEGIVGLCDVQDSHVRIALISSQLLPEPSSKAANSRENRSNVKSLRTRSRALDPISLRNASSVKSCRSRCVSWATSPCRTR